MHRQNAWQEINCKENKSEESKGRVNELKTTGSICESSRNKKFFGSGKAVIPYAANLKRMYLKKENTGIGECK